MPFPKIDPYGAPDPSVESTGKGPYSASAKAMNAAAMHSTTAGAFPTGATYSDVARAYKAHQLAALPGLRPLRERVGSNRALAYAARAPEVRIRQAWKPVPSPVEFQNETNEPPMTVAVTFDRVRDIVLEMKRQGIGEATITLVGWNVGGHDGRWPQLFPVEERLGGEERLRESVAAIKRGYDEFAACRDLQLEEMTGHRELAPGVAESTFSDGTQIVANASPDDFAMPDGTAVKSMDYIVVRSRRR